MPIWYTQLSTSSRLAFVNRLYGPGSHPAGMVIRRYYDGGILKDFGANIILIGCAEHVIKITRRLDQIAMVPKGLQTLWMISNSPP